MHTKVYAHTCSLMPAGVWQRRVMCAKPPRSFFQSAAMAANISPTNCDATSCQRRGTCMGGQGLGGKERDGRGERLWQG